MLRRSSPAHWPLSENRFTLWPAIASTRSPACDGRHERAIKADGFGPTITRMDEQAPPWRRKPSRGPNGTDPPNEEDELGWAIEVVRTLHDVTPATSTAAIERFEKSSKLLLPPDMRRFYTEFDGARVLAAEYVLYDPDGFLPLEVPIRAAWGRDIELARTWISIGRSRVGHCIGIDLQPPPVGTYRVAAWPASMKDPQPRLRPIAAGFTQFLTRILSATRHPYWEDEA